MITNDLITGEKFISLDNNTNIFYRHTHEVNDFFKSLPTNEKFILISHNSDGSVCDGQCRWDSADTNLIPNNLVKWFAQNVNSENDLVESLPIGLENSYNFPHLQKIEKIIKIHENEKKIKNLVYLNLNIQNNIPERSKIYDLLSNKNFVTSEMGSNGRNFDEYLDNVYNHKFVICSEGNGIDTHRTWETLYSGSIPIEKINKNNRFFNDLPICFVNDWEEITDDFLNSEIDRINKNIFNIDKLNFSYWENKIKNYLK